MIAKRVHLGNLIAMTMRTNYVDAHNLARRLGISRQSVFYLLRKPDMHVSKLQKVGEALNYDFFDHLTRVNKADYEKLVNGLTAEVKELKQQLEFRDKMIEVLSGKRVS